MPNQDTLNLIKFRTGATESTDIANNIARFDFEDCILYYGGCAFGITKDELSKAVVGKVTSEQLLEALQPYALLNDVPSDEKIRGIATQEISKANKNTTLTNYATTGALNTLKSEVSGKTTLAEVEEQGYAKVTDIPTKVSDLTNDSNFITSSATVSQANKLTNQLTIKKNNVAIGTYDGSSASVISFTCPTKVSDLTNDSKFITSSDTIANANKVGNLTPSQISAMTNNTNKLTNGAGFITKSVADLDNYYDKDSIDSLVSSKLERVTASTLPTSGDANKIYMIPKGTAETDNSFDEYMYISSKWELIGNSKTDLTDYYKKSETSGKTEISNALNAKSNTGHTHTSGDVSGLGTMALQNTSSYSSATQVNTALSKKSDTGHTHDDRYYTETEINTKLSEKSDTGHTHDYLPLSGGTVTGGTTFSGGSFGTELIVKRGDTSNGASVQFRGTDEVYGYLGSNSVKQPTWWDANKTAYTLLHSGNSAHTHNSDYVLKSGDTMTGGLTIPIGAGLQGNLVTSTAINGKTTSSTTQIAKDLGSFIGTWDSASLGWQNLINVRHRNGVTDGNQFGMYIRSCLTDFSDSLVYNKENAGTWSGERTILDSANIGKFSPNAKHCVVATDATAKKWYKVAEGKVIKGVINTDYNLVFNVHDTYLHPSQCATMRLRLRVDGTKGTIANSQFYYIDKTADDGSFDTDWVRVYYKGSSSSTNDGISVEIWTYLSYGYAGREFNVEAEFDRLTDDLGGGRLTFSNNVTAGTPPTIPTSPSATDWHLLSPTYLSSANFADKTHTHSYLPLSGGTINGGITGFAGNVQLVNTASTSILAYKNTNVTKCADGTLVGANTNPTYIRSSSDDLYHYNANKDANYKILDSNNSAHTHSYLPLSGGTMSGAISFDTSVIAPIKYKGTKSEYVMVRFVDNTADTYGNGICIGGGGLTVIGGGESSYNAITDLGYTGGDERMVITNDADIEFYSNCQTISAKTLGLFDASGYWRGKGFKRSGSSDSYVLLGGGGHKELSGFSLTSHTHNYLPLSGGTMNTGASITIPYSSGSRKAVINGSDVQLYGASSGNWADSLVLNTNDGTSAKLEYGAYGNANTLHYGFIGTAYNTPTVKIIDGKGIGVVGSVRVGATKSNETTMTGGCNMEYNTTTQCLEFKFT